MRRNYYVRPRIAKNGYWVFDIAYEEGGQIIVHDTYEDFDIAKHECAEFMNCKLEDVDVKQWVHVWNNVTYKAKETNKQEVKETKKMKMSEAWAALEAGKTLGLGNDLLYFVDGRLRSRQVNSTEERAPSDYQYSHLCIARIVTKLVDHYEALRDIVERDGAEYEIPYRNTEERKSVHVEKGKVRVEIMSKLGAVSFDLNDFRCKWEKIR